MIGVLAGALLGIIMAGGLWVSCSGFKVKALGFYSTGFEDFAVPGLGFSSLGRGCSVYVWDEM